MFSERYANREHWAFSLEEAVSEVNLGVPSKDAVCPNRIKTSIRKPSRTAAGDQRHLEENGPEGDRNGLIWDLELPKSL